MNRAEKEAFVLDFRERVQRAPAVYLTDFTGIDVPAMTKLRESLREIGAEYLVVKNRLAIRALAELDLPDLTDALRGPTGVVLGYEGPVEPARAISDFQREHGDRPTLKVGVLDNELLDVAAIERLAKLASRDELLSELAGVLEAPMRALAGALEAKLLEFVGLLEALRMEGGSTE